MYNITLRRVRVTVFAVEKLAIFAVEKQYVLHIVRVCNVIQHAMRMRRIVICGLPGSTVFFHVISQTALISKKKKLLNPKCVFIFPLQLLSENFSFKEELSEI